ncbi:MAG: hypothetical protein GY820_17780 [Gammaproteobacteria bacterium]|nr:hypothetical protein [Gammaproteobacteria bacterium]
MFYCTGDFKASFENAVFAALSAGVAKEVKGISDGWDWAEASALHGVTQGGIAVMRGDRFAYGLVAGFTSHAVGDNLPRGNTSIEERTLIATGAAAIAVEAAGGDGAGMAVQAALVHLFNAEEHRDRSLGTDLYDSQGSLFDPSNPKISWHVNDRSYTIDWDIGLSADYTNIPILIASGVSSLASGDPYPSGASISLRQGFNSESGGELLGEADYSFGASSKYMLSIDLIETGANIHTTTAFVYGVGIKNYYDIQGNPIGSGLAFGYAAGTFTKAITRSYTPINLTGSAGVELFRYGW